MARKPQPDRTYSQYGKRYDGPPQGYEPPSVDTFFTGTPSTTTGRTRRRDAAGRAGTTGSGRGRGGGPSGAGGGNGGTGGAGPGSGRRRRGIDYPRHGRAGVTRWIPSWRLVLSSFGILAGLLVVTVVVAYAVTPVEAVSDASLKQNSSVVFSDGSSLGQFSEEQRTVVPLAQVPLYVQRAVLAAEDRTFYQNRGISPTGILRAAWSNARGGSLQGGSTITQQYVKNFFLRSDRSVGRKAREFLISLKVAQQVPKNSILEDYLNKIYFGRNAYGIQAAAQVYFRKNVDKLTPSEGAYLAGIINGPELYDPLDGPESKAAAQVRWLYVLDGMVTEQWLAPADAAAAKAAGLPVVQPVARSAGRTGQRGYLMDMVAKEAQQKAGLTRAELASGGYLIRTTFDKNLIAQSVAAVEDALGPRKTWSDGVQIGMASIDPRSGAVLSIYGGDDERQQNAATQDFAAQAGSTYKPFALIAALEGNPAKADAGPLSLKSRFSGRSPYRLDDAKRTPIYNFGKKPGEQFGQIDLMSATAHSVNTVYAQLGERVTPDFVKQVAIRAGLPKTTYGFEGTQYVNSVLGTSSPHVIDMASAYATIAAKGIHSAPFVITEITKKENKGLFYKADAKKTRAFEEGVMADATYAMQQVVKKGTGTFARSLGRPVAGKTGTTTDNRAAWFVGFTPQLSTAVAVYSLDAAGNPQKVTGWGRFKNTEITGNTFPIRAWTAFMKSALDGAEVLQFPEPVYGGDEVNPAPPPAPTPSPEPSPSDTGAPQPTDGQPTDQPQPSPSDTGAPQPTDGQPTQPGGQPSDQASGAAANPTGVQGAVG